MELLHYYMTKIVYWLSLATRGYFSINVLTQIQTIMNVIAGVTNLKLNIFKWKNLIFRDNRSDI